MNRDLLQDIFVKIRVNNVTDGNLCIIHNGETANSSDSAIRLISLSLSTNGK